MWNLINHIQWHITLQLYVGYENKHKAGSFQPLTQVFHETIAENVLNQSEGLKLGNCWSNLKTEDANKFLDPKNLRPPLLNPLSTIFQHKYKVFKIFRRNRTSLGNV